MPTKREEPLNVPTAVLPFKHILTEFQCYEKDRKELNFPDPALRNTQCRAEQSQNDPGISSHHRTTQQNLIYINHRLLY